MVCSRAASLQEGNYTGRPRAPARLGTGLLNSAPPADRTPMAIRTSRGARQRIFFQRRFRLFVLVDYAFPTSFSAGVYPPNRRGRD